MLYQVGALPTLGSTLLRSTGNVVVARIHIQRRVWARRMMTRLQLLGDVPDAERRRSLKVEGAVAALPALGRALDIWRAALVTGTPAVTSFRQQNRPSPRAPFLSEALERARCV